MSKKYPNEYNGHRNWDYWNVALWIANDEGLYRIARSISKFHNSNRQAAKSLIANLPEKTPDGAKYTQRNLEAALRHIEE